MAIIIKEASKAPLAISGLANDMAKIYLAYNQQKLDQADREQERIWRREDKQLTLDNAAADREAQNERHRETTRIAQGQLDATIENNAIMRKQDWARINNQADQFSVTSSQGQQKIDNDFTIGMGNLGVAQDTLGLNRERFQDQSDRGWAEIEERIRNNNRNHELGESQLDFQKQKHKDDVGLQERGLEFEEERIKIQRDEALSRISLTDAQILKVKEETDALKQDRNFQQSSYDTIMNMDASLFTNGEEGRKQAANQAALGDFSSWQNLLIDGVSADESAEAFKFRQTNEYWKTVLAQRNPTWSDEQIAAKALEYTRANYVKFASGLIGAAPNAFSTGSQPGLQDGTDGSLAVGDPQNYVEVRTRTLTNRNGVSETVSTEELKSRAKAENVSVAEYIAGLKAMGTTIQ